MNVCKGGYCLNDILYDVAKIVICPFCHTDLSVSEKKLNCSKCKEEFGFSNFGYLSFIKKNTHINIEKSHYPEQEVLI